MRIPHGWERSQTACCTTANTVPGTWDPCAAPPSGARSVARTSVPSYGTISQATPWCRTVPSINWTCQSIWFIPGGRAASTFGQRITC